MLVVHVLVHVLLVQLLLLLLLLHTLLSGGVVVGRYLWLVGPFDVLVQERDVQLVAALLVWVVVVGQ